MKKNSGGIVEFLITHNMIPGSGAHMQELRRTRSGPFREYDSMITLFDLKDAMVMYQ